MARRKTETALMLPSQSVEQQDQSTLVLAEIYKRYRANPVFFAEHCLGHSTWSKQREILLSVASNQRTIVRASHSISKTYTAGEIAVWFLNCFPDSKVITTAPTFRQVRDLLWAEIGKTYKSSRYQLEGDCQIVSIRTDKPEHYALGFSSDKGANSEGFHAPAILYIFDEAKGIPQYLWESVKGGMTGGHCRWLVISTTDGVKSGEQFHNIFNNPLMTTDWNRISISANESPMVTGERFRSISIPDESRPDLFTYKYTPSAETKFQLASKQWIAECKADWGEDSVLYQTKVLGEICEKGFDSIIKYPDVLKMNENSLDANFKDDGAIEVGVDVARFGDDCTVFFKRKGMKTDLPQIFQKQSITDTATQLKSFVGFDKTIKIKVDDTGVGGGLTDIMIAEGYNIVPINFNQCANNPDKYPNAISEIWYEMADKIAEISMPKFDRLQVELVNRKNNGLDKKGRRTIESKDQYKKRGFRSPDVADAFLLCFYNMQELRIF
jgi:phage terminase large subunit